MHIYISKLTDIGSNNGFLPYLRPTIIWTNVGMLLIQRLDNKLRRNMNLNSHIFIQGNLSENVICKMLTIWSQLKCSKVGLAMLYQHSHTSVWGYLCRQWMFRILQHEVRDVSFRFSQPTLYFCWSDCLGAHIVIKFSATLIKCHF